MTTALATQNGNLAVVQPHDFNAEQIELIANMIGVRPGTSEFSLFINLAKAKRLDPLTKQIYCIKTTSGLQMFASIDGLRVIAERTGNYGGQTEPYWCGPDGVWRDVWLDDKPPSAAKVGVWKRGYEHPTWGVATFKSYGANKKNNWLSMPDVMLAKCAEALALRKAFPDDLSALYVREEFAEDETPPAPSRPVQAPDRAHRATPVRAEVVDAETGEIQQGFDPQTATQKQIKERIARLRDDLGWDSDHLAGFAADYKLNLRTREGTLELVELLKDALAAQDAQREAAAALDEDDEAAEAYEAQGTLLDADTAPIARARDWTER